MDGIVTDRAGAGRGRKALIGGAARNWYGVALNKENNNYLDKFGGMAAFILCIFYALIVLLPLLAIGSSSGFRGIAGVMRSPGALSAIRLSLLTTAASLAMTFILGTPAAFYIYRPGAGLASSVFGVISSIPVVLPPAVAGIALLLAFGRRSLPGLLMERIGVEIVFTFSAVILAQFFVSSGFYIQVLGTAIRCVEPEIYDISYVLGAGRIETFFRVIVPMLSRPAAAGLILAWSRSMGEFGATMMFAGNMDGVTRTMPLAIYTLMQTDVSQAAGMSLILAVISFAAMLAVRLWMRE